MADVVVNLDPSQPVHSIVGQGELPFTVTSNNNAVASAVQLTSTPTPCYGVRVNNPQFSKTGGTQQTHSIKVLVAPVGTLQANLTANMIEAELAPGQAEYFMVPDASMLWFTTADGNNSEDIHARAFLLPLQ
ncbi:MAG TPA: hypothetical protein VEZ90_10590 [Blastocatellia bacterium]|nr:hypothetical protein [Blastocatellia bacterium]